MSDSIKIENRFDRSNINKVLLKRRSGILYVSFNDGYDIQLLNMSSLNNTFNVPLTFGCSLNESGSPQRYFNGTLRNMSVKIYN